MKIRTLRMKDGFKEFATFDEEGALYTSEIPQLLPDTATMEGLMEYRAMEDFDENIDFDRLEIVEFDLIESDVIGADINNKLGSPLNLVSLLEVYFDKLPDGDKKDKLLQIIRMEMSQAKKNLEYIAQVL
jgi:hypothetical protein